jgi:hypothetical protein
MMTDRQFGDRVSRYSDGEDEKEEIIDTVPVRETGKVDVEEDDKEKINTFGGVAEVSHASSPSEVAAQLGTLAGEVEKADEARSFVGRSVLRHIFSHRRKRMLAHRRRQETNSHEDNPEEVSQRTPSPAPARLEMQTHEFDQLIRPGAFRVTPGGPVGGVRQREVEDDSDDSIEIQGVRRGEPGRTRIDEIYLVEADLVVDEPPNSVPAAPPPILVEALPLRRNRFVIFLAIASLLIMAIAVGVSLGVAAANNRTAPTDTTDTPVAPSLSPSASPSSIPTEIPSSYPSGPPSGFPSMQPSSSPSRGVTVTFLSSLPGFTVEEMRNASSPQSKAFEWVTTIDRPRSDLERIRQRFALATLFYATSGETKWKRSEGWLNSSIHECKWYGCICARNGTISSLQLDSNRLVGNLPREICLLGGLESLLLSENRRLWGTIPSEVGWMQLITSLNMDGTDISGSLPTEVGLLSRLASLSLMGTRLTGKVPSEVGRLRLLGSLMISDGQLAGLIPTELGRLSLLSTLDLGYNALSSSLPTELGEILALESIDVSGNNLTSSLPSELSDLAALQQLSCSQNSFNGSIPTEFGSLTRLSVFKLNDNLLTGSLPTELGRLSSLALLSLQSNRLNGTIPTELGSLTSLYEDLYVFQNFLTGTLPTELGRLSNVRLMDFTHNRLRGSVPSELCNLVKRGMELEIFCETVNCTCNCSCRDSELSIND